MGGKATFRPNPASWGNVMYKWIWKRLAAALFLSWAITAPAHADDTVGTPSIGGNCYRFGCGYTGEYQQVYGSVAFSGQ